MLTFPKLIAAIWFGVLAVFAAGIVVNHLEEGTQLGKYYYICGAVGVVIGWRFVGKRAYDALPQMMGYGVTACILIVFWSVLIFGGIEMYRKSIRLRYDGPVEALVGMVEHMVEYTVIMAKPDVLSVLLVGGIFGGWLVRFFAERTS